jgi:hypothetical protein
MIKKYPYTHYAGHHHYSHYNPLVYGNVEDEKKPDTTKVILSSIIVAPLAGGITQGIAAAILKNYKFSDGFKIGATSGLIFAGLAGTVFLLTKK